MSNQLNIDELRKLIKYSFISKTSISCFKDVKDMLIRTSIKYTVHQILVWFNDQVNGSYCFIPKSKSSSPELFESLSESEYLFLYASD